MALLARLSKKPYWAVGQVLHRGAFPKFEKTVFKKSQTIE